MELRPRVDELTHGLAGWFTCWQFDRAVMVYGRWVDGKLKETDKHGKYINDLDDILAGRKTYHWSPGSGMQLPLKYRQ